MTTVLFACVTALAWGCSAVTASQASRVIGGLSTMLWVLALGVVLSGPFAVAEGVPNLSARAWGWGAVAVVASLAGLGSAFVAMSYGKVGLVTAISSLQGAIAAIYGVIAGDRFWVLAAVGIAIASIGVFVLTQGKNVEDGALRHAQPTRAVTWALVGSTISALALFAADRAEPMSAAWVVTLVRAGAFAVVVPIALTGRLRDPRPVWRFVAFSVVAEVIGYGAFVLATRHGSVAIAAVIASQFALVATFVSFVIFRERLSRMQLTGAAAILAGVAVLVLSQPG